MIFTYGSQNQTVPNDFLTSRFEGLRDYVTRYLMFGVNFLDNLIQVASYSKVCKLLLFMNKELENLVTLYL